MRAEATGPGEGSGCALPAVLARLNLLDSPPQEAFGRVTRLAAALLDAPVVLLTLLVEDEHIVLSHAGPCDAWASPREIPLARAIGSRLRGCPPERQLAVADVRTCEWVDAAPDDALRACAATPLLLDGRRVGALWVADERPRCWSERELGLLADLAAQACGELELRAAVLDRDQAQADLYDGEERIRQAFDNAIVGMVVTSLDPDDAGRIIRVNRAFCRLVGRSEEALVGASVGDITHPQDRALTDASLAALARGELHAVSHLEKRYVHADGHTVWGALTTSALISGEGSHRHVISLVEDITDRKQAERDLPAIASVLRRILSGADARQAIAQAAVDIAGASSAHLIERAGPDRLIVTASACLNLVGVEVRLDAPSATARTFLDGRPLFLADPAQDPLVSPELLEIARARSIMWQPIFSHEGVIGVLCVCWAERLGDISARAARAVALLTVETAVALAHRDALERLAAQATTDPLTELPNRRAWDERLTRELAGARRRGQPLTLALVDMDRFRHYNDTRGHAAGDELLRDFAAAARVLLREGDTIARWGGEEFAILLPNCPSAGFASSVLERVRATVPAGQSCSVGHATWDGLESAEELVERAARALRRAKALGRDRSAQAARVQANPS